MLSFHARRSEFAMTFRASLHSRMARKRRYEKICQLVDLSPEDRVLDVGCGEGRSFEEFNGANEIVGLDLNPEQSIFQDNFRFVHGDASSMEFFVDREFDVVICVGVLERVIPFYNLQRAAREIARVGKAYAVVVPHLLTPIDPYSHLPLWQLFPRNFSHFSRRWGLTAHFQSGIVDSGEERIFYLRAKDWQKLFPGSKILPFRFAAGGLVLDAIIYKRRPE